MDRRHRHGLRAGSRRDRQLRILLNFRHQPLPLASRHRILRGELLPACKRWNLPCSHRHAHSAGATLASSGSTSSPTSPEQWACTTSRAFLSPRRPRRASRTRSRRATTQTQRHPRPTAPQRSLPRHTPLCNRSVTPIKPRKDQVERQKAMPLSEHACSSVWWTSSTRAGHLACSAGVAESSSTSDSLTEARVGSCWR